MRELVGRKKYLDISKGIGIILVVLGHSFPDENSISGISIPLFAVLKDLIYTFHMPLFFFVAGYLATSTINCKEKLKLRIKQLIIPYLTMSILYLPLRFFASNLASSQYSVLDAWKIVIGISSNGGMWFLYVLALSYVVSFLIYKEKNAKGLVLIFFIALLLTRGNVVNIDYSVLRYFCYNYFFFIVGLHLHLSLSNFEKELLKINTNLIGIFYVVLFAIYAYWKVDFLSPILACLGVAGTVAFSYQREEKIPKILSNLGQNSMYIYLFHGPIQVIIRYLFWTRWRLNYCLCVIVMFLTGMLFSVVIKMIVVKFPVINWFFTGKLQSKNSKVL